MRSVSDPLFVELREKITLRTARVVVVGGGYVGRPLADACVGAGFHTTVYDTNESKCAELRAVNHRAVTVSAVLRSADVVVICVPTPLNKTKDPDNTHVLAVAEELLDNAHAPRLVILESTTFPGFTRQVFAPKLHLSIANRDFVAFSPERTDPGNAEYNISNTPKIVAGADEESAGLATAFYEAFVERKNVVQVSSTDTAEMVKLLENTFRAVNIGLVNEVAIMCRHLNLDVWEVIEAAATKPYGFMPFYPGPGIGGHCIPVDPLYLSWQLKTLQYDARFIQLADQINSAMPALVVDRVTEALNGLGLAVRDANILLLGVAYKPGVGDVRESPALEILACFEKRGAAVVYFDRYVESVTTKRYAVLPSCRRLDSALYAACACAVIVTDHPDVDYEEIVRSVPVTVDCRNATKAFRAKYPGKVVML
jgi:UDP-N-acetyl-D-glucosamine dehydrogenase